MSRSLSVAVIAVDALEFEADVLVLKYARSLHGLDQHVFRRLNANGIDPKLPDENKAIIIHTASIFVPRSVLVVGVKQLWEFGYREIRDFARSALSALAVEAPTARDVVFTLHGAGYGLDEIEAFKSEIAGIMDAVSEKEIPPSLEVITFVEADLGRAVRMSLALTELLPDGVLPINAKGDTVRKLSAETRRTLRTVGYTSAAKPHVFVAMPFAPEMEDVFHYGIQGAVNAAGLLCERADLAAFTGDVMEWVRHRISTSKLVVADLSTCNPNVYLEVGYAWGCRVPTVLLAHDANDLKFDVKGQRCIMYKTIRQLEELLRHELKVLNSRV